MKRELQEDNQITKKPKHEIILSVNGTSPRELDQFFTKPDVAKVCVYQLNNVLTNGLSKVDLVLEPSFGDGAFVKALQNIGITSKLKFVDIDASEETYRADFLKDTIVPKSYFHPKKGFSCVTVGNPPFGKNSSLAVSFFNHAAKFSVCIAFIVPRTFSKKSLQSKLDRNFFLVHEMVLEEDGFLFKNESYDVPCVFQVWVHSEYGNIIKSEILKIAPMQIPSKNPKLRLLETKITKTPAF